MELWIPDSNYCLWDSGFLELNSIFQSPGPDSGIQINLTYIEVAIPLGIEWSTSLYKIRVLSRVFEG